MKDRRPLHGRRSSSRFQAATEGAQLRPFRLAITGDVLNEHGVDAYGGLPRELLDGAPHIEYEFLRDLAPRPGDDQYWHRFYSLEVSAAHLVDLDGLVLLRPWIKREALASARERLVVIGRSGAGYDKVDVASCTDFNIALFNAPMALNHPTA